MRWFKFKSKNRRAAERHHLLDVKLRTRQTRAAKVRWTSYGVLGIAIFAGGAFLVCRGGQLLLDRLVYQNPSFAIRVIDIQTDGVISPATLRRWAMVRQGENLFALDLMQVKRDLELRPSIEFVAVERILPHTLKISVNERQPIAQTHVFETLRNGGSQPVIYDFDADGYVMKPLDPSCRAVPAPTNEVLPELVGISPLEVQAGRQVESMQIRSALDLLCEMEHSPMAGMADLRQISVDAPEILEASTGQGAQITFASDHFDVQLRRWRQINDQYQRWGKTIVSLDLSVTNNLPVRSAVLVLTPGVPTVPAVKITKPFHVKRKNV